MADELMLEICERRFEDGDKSALIWAVDRCFREGGEIPLWVTKGFVEAVRKVRRFDADTWEDVFGKPHDGRKTSLLREKRDKRWQVVEVVNELRRTAIKGDTFQMAADQVGVSKATAKRYYDEIYRYATKPKRLRKLPS